MIFKSAEIRWFADDKDMLWNIYEQVHPKGKGIIERSRTDYYLRSGLPNTGIKIREGNHELKVKAADDEPMTYGVIQHWIKWSTREEQHILNTIDNGHLTDWIGVEKYRCQKMYAVSRTGTLVPEGEAMVLNGCGVEFTEIHLPASQLTKYTLGLEAFGPDDNSRPNLMAALDNLNLNLSLLAALPSHGYPEWLKQLVENKPGV